MSDQQDDAFDKLITERDAAVKEMEARELHHFEVEEENARLRARIAQAVQYAQSVLDDPTGGRDDVEYLSGRDSAARGVLDILRPQPQGV